MQFVQNCRRFARIPDPNFQILSVTTLFKRIENLTQNQLNQDSVQFRMSIKPENLQIKADPDLIEQVLLNLMTNAIEALNETDQPKIQLIAEMNYKSNMIIRVTDNVNNKSLTPSQ
jgi:two-component system, NtrC family, nitrogen regulation sensor histidine kinase NtrY